MVRGGILIASFIFFTIGAAAQAPTQPTPGKDFPTTLEPIKPASYYSPKKQKKKKKSKSSTTYSAREDYDKRIDGILDERERRETSGRQLKEDERMKPPYFGHKKPPKVRPIGKRKQCKVCGIRH